MILTLTGASGAGKTTIARELLKKLPIQAQMVPSYTTRKPRCSDIPGEYKYISKFRFGFLKKIGVFLWTVYPHGHSYGTTKRWVSKALRDDSTIYVMILIPDVIKTLQEFAEKRGLLDQIYSFYLFSPHQDILKKRLEKRGDGAEEVQKRLTDCIRWDQNASRSSIPYEFVRNNREIQEPVAEIKNRFLMKFKGRDSLF